MRNDPRQLTLFDAKGQAPAPPPPPAAPAAREVLSLDLGDRLLGRITGYDEFGDADFWQRVAEGVGDGISPDDCYVLVRFHADPEAKVYRRKVRSDFIMRDMEWAIETTLFEEAQSFFYRLTGDATPRRLRKR